MFAVYARKYKPTSVAPPAFVAVVPVKGDANALAGIGIVGPGWKTFFD
ncbi:hypothetical protein [Sphingomonas sp. CFBP 13706]|nr:hypothetical protein [Sphingomonas sp. CFBP 13706]MBD8735710.1 hypothetical protein [Sphingomonas sp. CFBP 13706]